MSSCCDDYDSDLTLPQVYDFLPRLTGDTWPGIVFSIEVDSVAEDFTGCIVEIAFKKSHLTSTVSLLLSTETSDITISTNVITVEPRILELLPGSYIYDLQVTYPDSRVRTFLKGSFKVLRDVTPNP